MQGRITQQPVEVILTSFYLPPAARYSSFLVECVWKAAAATPPETPDTPVTPTTNIPRDLAQRRFLYLIA